MEINILSPQKADIAVLLIISGVGLFGVYTAFVARLFVAEDKKGDEKQLQHLIEEIRLLRREVEGLKIESNVTPRVGLSKSAIEESEKVRL